MNQPFTVTRGLDQVTNCLLSFADKGVPDGELISDV